MVSSKAVLSVFSLCSILAVAAPTTTHSKAFSIHQVSIPKKRHHPVVDYAYALGKYAKTIPASVAAAAAAAASGSAVNNPANGDEEYIVQVNVGNGVLNLDFDTGSSDLYVHERLKK